MTEREKRELDAWIAEHVMGWKRVSGKLRIKFKDENGSNWYVGRERALLSYECDHPEDEMFHPSDDPASSMKLWKKLVERCRFITTHCDNFDGVLKYKIIAAAEIATGEIAIGETLELAIALFARTIYDKFKL